jgi:hypothetical protein
MIENLALRQQPSTVLQKRRPRIGLVDRAFWVVLRASAHRDHRDRSIVITEIGGVDHRDRPW